MAGLLTDPLVARLRYRVSRRARRISLRVDPALGAIVVVRPPRASDAAIAAFVAAQRRWIERQLAELPGPMVIGDGTDVPVFGETLTLRHARDGRGGVWREGAALMVSGQLEHVPRRACDWLRAEAKRELSTMVRQAAERLGRPVARISIRDPRSRWGSCNRNGVICLSWRLALAPTPVARYVVAHEVAHLRHLNHSAAFWRTVATLVDGVEEARAWLRAHGASLHRFGRIER